MIATLDLAILLDSPARASLITSGANRFTPAPPQFVLRDTVALRIRFYRRLDPASSALTQIDLGEDASLAFGAKVADYVSANDYLFFANLARTDESAGDFTDINWQATLNLNTEEFIDAFTGVSNISIKCECEVIQDGQVRTVAQFDATGIFDVIRGTEPPPTTATPAYPAAPTADTVLAGSTDGLSWVKLTFANLWAKFIANGALTFPWSRVSGTPGFATSAEMITGTDTAKFANAAGSRAALRDYVDPLVAARFALRGVHFAGGNAEAPASLSNSPVFIRARLVWPALGSNTNTQPFIAGLAVGNSRTTNSIALAYRSSDARLRVINYTDTSNNRFREYNLADAGNEAVDLVVVSQGSSAPLVYSNGTLVAPTSGTDTVIGIGPAWDAIEQRSYTRFFGPSTFNTAVLFAVEYGNVALSASEVTRLYGGGWSTMPHYLHSAGAGDRYVGSFAAGVDGWTAAGASTITAPYDSGDAGYAETLRVVAGDGVAERAERPVSGLGVGKVFRWSINYKPVVITGSGSIIVYGQSGDPSYATRSYSGPQAWQSWSTTFTSQNTGFLARAYSVVSGGAAGDEVLIASPRLTALGLVGSYIFDSENAGWVERNRAGGSNPLLLGSNPPRILPGDRISVPTTVVHAGAGNLQLTGQPLLPNLGWRLVAVSARASVNVTIQLGNASGGAQVVASTALTAGQITPLVLASGATMPSTVNVWSNASAAASVEYYLEYARTDLL